ncbi:MAG: undecaprenyl-diphosphate phosphatase [Nitrosomonadales bacterium]|jgi:undecaprenyl-diphosphatase|nr:undecaprenyl-diphosphate phosphatase [Nitrosomonadales bacterium]MBT4571350.1 undecaprenyl-diphosphate phosphatase [Nitrosomonadales bacterium]MBT4758849.1 undecaprenyl-diphosphate phosphatase [Nitrosomonadales bacterium]MBT5573350.1 undecaprenyl-diphosphate phosphatase [Nitrosomonadales bacterium]
MDLYLLWVAFILGIVEGITEFIPVSSTGHLILAAELLKFNDDSSKVFEIVIQLGAILAVMVEYKNKLIQTFKGALHEKVAQNFIIHLFIAFLPAAIMGLLFHQMIKLYLFNPMIVGISLVIGGFIMILIEKKLTIKTKTNVDQITKKQALVVGLAQCFALIPGVSRSASTIMGGLISGLDRKTATEFSFFLAIPIIFAASLFDLVSNFSILNMQHVPIFLIGFITAFFSAYLIIKVFIKYVANHDFIMFGWYRIIVGIIAIFYFF